MRSRVAVIGAGSWGTTVAHLTAAQHATVLWARDPAVADEINDRTTCNSRYLPGYDLCPDLQATSDLARRRGPGRRRGDGRAVARASGRRSSEVGQLDPGLGAGRQPDQGPRAGHAACA